MSLPFDIRALDKRTFGGLVDQIAPGWAGNLGFRESGPVTIAALTGGGTISEEHAETRRRFAPILDALRSGALAVVDANGATVPRSVWFAGQWTFYRDRRGIERLEIEGVKHFDPRFVVAEVEVEAAPADDKPGRRGRRSSAEKPGYGELPAAVTAARKRYTKALAALPSRKSQAEFLAGKLGCSASTVEKIMRGPRK